MRLYFIIIIVSILNLGSATSYAQDSPGVITYDTSYNSEGYDIDEAETEYSDLNSPETDRKYQRQYMNEDRLQALRKQNAFKYKNRDSLSPPPTRPVAEGSPSRTLDASILLWLLAIVAIIILVLQLSGMNMRQLLSPRRLLNKEVFLSANIHDVEYDKAIQDAVNGGNFSLATRYMYLEALKRLSDKKIIAWHVNKTNWQYVYEVERGDLRNSFREITQVFEYVQYGHMPISREKFDKVNKMFHSFNMHLS